MSLLSRVLVGGPEARSVSEGIVTVSRFSCPSRFYSGLFCFNTAGAGAVFMKWPLGVHSHFAMSALGL